MKVLIAPLNWGLGHASRCIPLIVQHLRQGDDVVLAGDGDSLTLLRKHFPNLHYYSLAPLRLRYSKHSSQVGAMLMALPRLIRFIRRDHRELAAILRKENIDLVISDNRFGLYSKQVRCAYITHQLLIRMPHRLHFLEPLAHRVHLSFISKFDECLIPDYADSGNLSGDLSHKYPLPANARFIGPLSRFSDLTPAACQQTYDAVAVLSGLEPQRTMMEKAIRGEYAHKAETLLLIQGCMNKPMMTITRGNVTTMPYISDGELAWHLLHTQTIISRSGYSSLMDYAALGLFEKQKRGEVHLRLIPTPGQPEQEYLAALHNA